MIIIDEYLAVRVILGQWPEGMPDDDVALPTHGHWRLLQALHNPRGGQLTRLLAPLPEPDRSALRWPHREVLQVLDPRPLLDDAARLAARYGGGLRNAEILAAGVAHHQAHCGSAIPTTWDHQSPPAPTDSDWPSTSPPDRQPQTAAAVLLTPSLRSVVLPPLRRPWRAVLGLPSGES